MSLLRLMSDSDSQECGTIQVRMLLTIVLALYLISSRWKAILVLSVWALITLSKRQFARCGSLSVVVTL